MIKNLKKLLLVVGVFVCFFSSAQASWSKKGLSIAAKRRELAIKVNTFTDQHPQFKDFFLELRGKMTTHRQFDFLEELVLRISEETPETLRELHRQWLYLFAEGKAQDASWFMGLNTTILSTCFVAYLACVYYMSCGYSEAMCKEFFASLGIFDLIPFVGYALGRTLMQKSESIGKKLGENLVDVLEWIGIVSFSNE